jgi:hypothetical protein
MPHYGEATAETLSSQRRSIDKRKRPHRDRRTASERQWRGEKSERRPDQLVKSSQVLDNWNSCPQQDGMGGTRPIGNVVDVPIVDPDQGYARVTQQLGPRSIEVRLVFKIAR